RSGAGARQPPAGMARRVVGRAQQRQRVRRAGPRRGTGRKPLPHAPGRTHPGAAPPRSRSMKLDRAAIALRVPHAGAMCLLDAVIDWDGRIIECEAIEPGPAHPLAREGRLPAIAAAEYAAQATAVHGALLDGVDAPRPGMLAKLSGL